MIPANAFNAIRTESRWERRLQRVQELQEAPGTSKQILDFYAGVLKIQHDIAKRFTIALRTDRDFHGQIEIPALLSPLESLLTLAIQSGPALLANRAREIQALDPAARNGIFVSSLSATPAAVGDLDYFFARACIQPVAEALQLQAQPSSTETASACATCGAVPQLFILRGEGEGAARWLQCSWCLREWMFRRVICPWCGETDKEKLPRFSVEGCGHVVIFACDSCRHYLKAIDLSIDGNAVPLVDEVAFAALDVWAAERGYAKIGLNLMGL